MINQSNQIEIRHLRYFMAVAKEKNFRKASEQLFITQPGLSRQIKQMEDALGVKLFNRTNKKVSITPAGEYLLKELEFTFNHLESTFNQLQLINDGQEGEIRLGFVNSAMQNLIPPLLKKIQIDFPNIHFSLKELSSSKQIEQLNSNEIDIGFVRSNIVPDTLNIQTIFQEKFAVVLPKAHPLNERNFRHVGQLSKEPFIMFSKEDSPDYYNKIMSICEQRGFTPQVSHRTVHDNTIFKLVESGLGVAIVPNSFRHGLDLNIKFIELKNITQEAKLSVVWSKGNRNMALKKFLNLLLIDEKE
jgi:DNA-binding transcriptional LysR family regulator